MNEPYQRVHKQEDSNSSLYGTIAAHVGTGVAIQGAQEIGLNIAHRKSSGDVKKVLDDVLHLNTNIDKAGLHNPLTGTNYYDKMKPGKLKSLVGKVPLYGQSTAKGRILSYGMAVATGIFTGTAQSKLTD